MLRDAYFVTRSAPRALIEITLSNTSISVSIGVAICPPNPPQLTTPHRSRSPIASLTLCSDVRSNAMASQPVSAASASSLASFRPAATTFAPSRTRCRTVAAPIPPLAPVTRIGPLS